MVGPLMQPERRRRAGRPPVGDAPARVTLRFRVTEVEAARLKAVAERNRTSVTDYVRLAVIGAAEEAGEAAPLRRPA